MNDECDISISRAGALSSTKVVFPQGAMVWGKTLSGVRKLNEVVVPEGMERICNYLFWACDIENVIVSSSVKEIGTEAFCYCHALRTVVF